MGINLVSNKYIGKREYLLEKQKMGFKTKVDLSDNRQVRQSEKTNLILSGGTTFGLPFSAMTAGPDLATSGITSSYTPSNLTTFTGTTGATVFVWADSNMALGYNSLTPLTPTNSGTTQYTYGFTGATATTVDSNRVYLTYTGVSFDLSVETMVSLGGGVYSGNCSTDELSYLLADGLDFRDRMIWVDVRGITRTDNLIVTSGITFNDVTTLSKTISIGTLNLSSATGATVAHGISTKFTGITSVDVIIMDDTGATMTGFLNQSGNTFSINSTNIILTKGSTFYNNANYDGTTLNRGYVTIHYVA
jgi:hypothetical protein